MAWEVPVTINDTTYPVHFDSDSEPSKEDMDWAVAQLEKAHSGELSAFGVRTKSGRLVQPESPLATFGGQVGKNILPAAATALGAAGTALLATPETAGFGAIPAAIAGGTGAGAAAQATQDATMKAQMGEEGYNQWREQQDVNAMANPFAAKMGGFLGQAPAMLGGGAGAGRLVANKIGGSVLENAVAGSILEGSGAAQRAVSGEGSASDIPEAIVAGAVKMGPLGFIPHADGILKSILLKAPSDAAVMALSSQLYDRAVHGKPLDAAAIAQQTGEDIPGFMLLNAVGALFHARPTMTEKVADLGHAAASDPNLTPADQALMHEQNQQFREAMGVKEPAPTKEPVAPLQTPPEPPVSEGEALTPAQQRQQVYDGLTKEIRDNFASGQPVHAPLADSYGIRPPEGWTKEGEFYQPPVEPQPNEPNAPVQKIQPEGLRQEPENGTQGREAESPIAGDQLLNPAAGQEEGQVANENPQNEAQQRGVGPDVSATDEGRGAGNEIAEGSPAAENDQKSIAPNPVQDIIDRKVSELRRERQAQFSPEIQQRIADYARGDTKKAVGLSDVQKNVANAVKSEFVKRKFAEHPEEPIKAQEKPEARPRAPAEEFNQQRRKEASEARKTKAEMTSTPGVLPGGKGSVAEAPTEKYEQGVAHLRSLIGDLSLIDLQRVHAEIARGTDPKPAAELVAKEHFAHKTASDKVSSAIAAKEIEPGKQAQDLYDKAYTEAKNAPSAPIASVNADFKDRDVPIQIKAATPKLTDKQTESLSELQRVLKKKIVFFEPEKGSAAPNGFVHSAHPDTIFLNAHGKLDAISTFGHEFTHSVGFSHPELLDELKEVIKPLIKGDKDYLDQLNESRRKAGLKDLDPDELHEEIIADYIGQRILKPDFLEKLAKEDPKLFQKIAAVLREWIAKIKDALKTSHGESFVSDLDKADAAVLKMMKEVASTNPDTSSAAHGEEHLSIPEEKRLGGKEVHRRLYQAEQKGGTAARDLLGSIMEGIDRGESYRSKLEDLGKFSADEIRDAITDMRGDRSYIGNLSKDSRPKLLENLGNGMRRELEDSQRMQEMLSLDAPERREEEGIARIKEHLQRQNEELGRDDIPEDIRQSIPESFERASQKLTADPKAGEKLVDQLVENPRQVTPDESALLSNHLVYLDKGLKANAKIINDSESDPAEKAEAQMRYAELDSKLDKFQEASLKAGSEWGRVGRWMQQRLKEDYSLANMITRAKTKGGGELSEKDTADVTKLHAELEKSQKQVAELEKDKADTALESLKEEHGDFTDSDWWNEAKKSMSPERLKVAEGLENELRRQNEIRKALAQIDEDEKAAANAPKGESQERLSIMSSEDIKASIKGKSKAELLKELSDSEAKSDKLFSALEKGASEPVRKAIQKAKAKKGEPVDIGKVTKAVESLKGKILSDVPHSLLEEIAKYHIQQGVKSTEELSSKISETLKPIGDFTPDEVNAALSKYGQLRFPSGEETDVKLRQHKGVMLLLSQLKDALTGNYPSKTGYQRDKATARQRELTKEITRKLKELGIQPPDGDKTTLASRKQAIVSRLQNEIEELNRVIEGKAKPKGDLQPVEYDAEMKKLAKERDELKAYVKDLTGPSPAHEWNEKARKAADRLTKLYDERIEALKRGEKPEGKKPTPEATAATQKAKDAATAKREEYQKLRDTLHPEIQEAKDTASLVKRLQKRREDLVNRLIKGKESETPGKQVKQTPESEALQKEVDRLSEAIKQIEGPRRLTEEQRTAAAEKAIQKSITEVERRIKEGDLKPKTKGTPVEESPKLKALRQEKAFLDEIHDSMKEAANPLSEREIAHYQKVLERRSADYEGRIKEIEAGTYAKPEKKIRELTQAQGEERLKGDRLRQQFVNKLGQLEKENRPQLQKALDKAVNYRTAGILSNPGIIAKLFSAVFARIGSTGVEDIIGGVIQKVAPRLAERAPLEGGGFDASSYAKAVRTAWKKGNKAMVDIIKTGTSDLDLQNLKAAREAGLLTLPGRAHGAVKAYAKEFAYDHAFDKLTEFYQSQGVDVTNPLVADKIASEAYQAANRAIFMQKDALTSLFNRALEDLDRKGHHISAAALRGLFPVFGVPTRIVAESAQYVGGLPIGLAKAVKAYRAGIEKLKPEEADMIVRQLKKGSLGSAMMLLGFFGAGSIGGYYSSDDKRKSGDVKPGGIRVFGVDVPKWALHAPPWEALHFGATMRRQLGSGHKISDAAIASGLGMVEHTPFVNEVFRMHDLRNAKSRGEFFNEFAKTSLEPAALTKLAEWTDRSRPFQASDIFTGEGTNKRAPEGLGQTLESGIPGLRENTPLKIAKPLEGTQLILPHGLDFGTAHKADIEKKNPRMSDTVWEKFNELRSERIRALVVPKINALKRMSEDDARHAASEITRLSGIYAKQRAGLK